MAETNIAKPRIAQQFEGFSALTVPKQISLMILVAGVLGLAAVMYTWMNTPTYQTIFAGLNDRDRSELVSSLVSANIPYRIESGSGAVQVPMDRVSEARMSLAGQGITPGASRGFEMMSEQGYGTSQFLEQARYFKSLEGELERSIAAFAGVATVRVHLAIPKHSAFIRKKHKPTASILVRLRPGRIMDKNTGAAIVQMVAGSVPNLVPSNVTIVDHLGRLLSGKHQDGAAALTNTQLDYTQKVQDLLVERIETILTPVVGVDGSRAQVNVELDFTQVSETQEQFLPDTKIIRSQQLEQRSDGGADAAVGVPGSLSNQPPSASSVPEAGAGKFVSPEDLEAAALRGGKGTNSSQSVVNYELNKTIRRVDRASGGIKRMSIAVVVNDKFSAVDNKRVPLTPEAVANITNLIKESVGFDEERGDTIQVTNVPFIAMAATEAEPELPIWQTAWFIDTAKQVVGGLLLFLLVLMILRPISKTLSMQQVNVTEVPDGSQAAISNEEQAMLDSGQASAESAEAARVQIDNPEGEQSLEVIRGLIADDPKHVSQIVKNWIKEDG